MKLLALRSLFAALVSAVCVFGANVTAAQNSYVIGYITDLSGPLANSYTPTWRDSSSTSRR